MDPLLPIRSLDYTVIFVRNMPAMREFYGTTLGFPLHKQLGPKWLEFRVGSNVLALTERGLDGPLQLSGADLPQDLARLGSMGIRTLYVEGGPTLVSSLLREGLVDEVHLYLASKLLGGDGVAIRDLGIQSIAGALHLEIAAVTRLADDVLITAVPRTGSDR